MIGCDFSLNSCLSKSPFVSGLVPAFFNSGCYLSLPTGLSIIQFVQSSSNSNTRGDILVCLWISFLKYSHFLPWISKEIKLGKCPLKWKVFIISWTGMNTAQIYLDSYNQNVVQIPFLSLGFLADQSESETKSSMPLDTQMFFFLWMCSFSHRYLISTV